MNKIIFFILILINFNSFADFEFGFGSNQGLFGFNQGLRDQTKPVLLEPQCDPYNEPICITFPREGQIFVTNICVTGCLLCTCLPGNGFICSQRALSSLTVRGTTRKPNVFVSVVLINTKFSSGDNDLTLEATTTSTRAPDGTGVWTVTFQNILNPRPPPFMRDGIPTKISARADIDWNTNFATRNIFIKKDRHCVNPPDCDLACRKSHFISRSCLLHTFDKLTKAIRDKYNE